MSKIDVVIFKTKSGEKYYVDGCHPEKIAAILKKLPNWTNIKRVKMTEEEYNRIPTTYEAAKLFELY